jgi:serine/threonine-protein kinase HipA
VSQPERLAVWLYGTLVAEITKSRNNRLSLQFSEEALDRFGPDSPILSTSLLVRAERYRNSATRDFFDGLLPEGDARNAIVRAINEGTPDNSKLEAEDTYGLLAEIGRENAGALIVQPGTDAPTTGQASDAQPISDDEVARRIARLPTSPLGVDTARGIRLSLPGVQRKLLLIRRTDGGWALPAEGLPSTHILKPQIADTRFPNSVENEAFCMKLAARVGLNVANVEVQHFNGKPVLVVERFDRRLVSGRLERIHQEDACQALGLRSKYEQDGGPSFRRLANLLSSFGREGDLRDLLALATFNIIIGNADAHGKNYSVFHFESGQIALTPGYDLMSTALYPDLDTVLGTYVDNVRQIQSVTRYRLVNEGESWGLSPTDADETVTKLLERVSDVFSDLAGLEPYEPNLSQVVETRTSALCAADGADDHSVR